MSVHIYPCLYFFAHDLQKKRRSNPYFKWNSTSGTKLIKINVDIDIWISVSTFFYHKFPYLNWTKKNSKRRSNSVKVTKLLVLAESSCHTRNLTRFEIFTITCAMYILTTRTCLKWPIMWYMWHGRSIIHEMIISWLLTVCTNDLGNSILHIDLSEKITLM